MKKYILYADDDMDDFEFLESALKEVDPEIEMVNVVNGYELIKYLQVREESTYPMLIVLDSKMPLLSGRETLGLLKTDSHFRNIPVALLSTMPDPRDREEMAKTGTRIFEKPDVYEDWRKIAHQLLTYSFFIFSLSQSA